MTESRVIPGGTIKWSQDATANDSDKSFTTPVGKVREYLAVYLRFVTTATVGNRLLAIHLYPDGVLEMGRPFTSGTIAASLDQRYMIGFGSITDDTSSGANTLVQGAPRCIIPAGGYLRIFDTAAVDAAADDLTVNLHYIEYDA